MLEKSHPRIHVSLKNNQMVNIFKSAISGIRKALDAAQGLGIEADQLPASRK